MSAEIQVFQAGLDDRLVLVGLGVDMPGLPSLASFRAALALGRVDAAAASAWQPKGSLWRAVHSALDHCAWEGLRHQSVGTLLMAHSEEISQFLTQVDFTGPVMDFSGEREPLPELLRQAHEWLAEREVEAVLIAGADTANPASGEPVSFGFDAEIHAGQPGAGAAAVIVMRRADAVRLGLSMYAELRALAVVDRPEPANLAEAIAGCARAALQEAHASPDQIGVLSATANGDDALDRPEINGLCQVYQGSPLSTALAGSRAIHSSLNGVNGLVGFIYSAVCLSQRLRPGIQNWHGPKFEPLWSGSNFYVLPNTLTWFHPAGDRPRLAALSCLAQGSACAHLVLAEGRPAVAARSLQMNPAPASLIPLAGDSRMGWDEAITALIAEIEQDGDLAQTAARAYWRLQDRPAAALAVFVAHNSEEARRELEFGRRGIPSAIEKGSDWQTPGGSYFTPNPLGPDTKVTFVYPGAFNSYVGAGQDLFQLFPSAYDHFQEVAGDIGAVLCEQQLYPRSLAPLQQADLERAEKQLQDDPNAMMTSGTSLSVALTTVFRDVFRIEPYSALGYSLGENSMMFALGVWADGLEASRQLIDSPLFHSRLAGAQNAVREYWGLAALPAGVHPHDILWENYLLMAPVERVMETLRGEKRVYLTHINTPRQVVIGGDPPACRRVIEALKCSSLRAPFDYVLHCAAMQSEYDAIVAIHSLSVVDRPTARLYSAAEDKPFVLNEAEIAHAIAKDLCSMLDFPRLVETAYGDGARCFIELGAGSNCAKWVDEILRGRPCLSVSANRKGTDDASAIFRVLARLWSHHIRINVAPLYQKGQVILG